MKLFISTSAKQSEETTKTLTKKVSVGTVQIALTSQNFHEFYEGDFTKYIEGGKGAPSKDQIVSKLYAILMTNKH